MESIWRAGGHSQPVSIPMRASRKKTLRTRRRTDRTWIGSVLPSRLRAALQWRWNQVFRSALDRNLSDLRNVAVMIGPCGHLSTLIGGILYLHPHCQVLSHAEDRVFQHESMDFLSCPSQGKLHEFCRFALHAAKWGLRGGYGGSILHSHAFDYQNLVRACRSCFEERPGMKKKVHSVVWKADLAGSRVLRENQEGLPFASIYYAHAQSS